MNYIYKLINRTGNIYRFAKIPKNKGSGAGGANTNANGLAFEAKTSLKDYMTEVKKENGFPVVKFPNCDKEFIYLPRTQLQKYMKNKGEMSDAPKMHGAKEPDQCYFDPVCNKIIIVECKNQNGTGSAAEKIQGVTAKIDNYKEQYPSCDIKFVFCLSNWFKTNIPAELKYLEKNNITVFWGDEPDFHKDVIKYISEC